MVPSSLLGNHFIINVINYIYGRGDWDFDVRDENGLRRGEILCKVSREEVNKAIDSINFYYLIGIKNHKYKPITFPSSSAPNFNYEVYMRSVDILREFDFLNAGFSYAGYVLGRNNVRHLMEEHKYLMVDFRNMVIQFYKEKPETKYVFDKIWPWLKTRTDVGKDYTNHPMIRKLSVSMIYGMLISLGYRKV